MKALGKVIRIDEGELRGHPAKMVRGTVGEAIVHMCLAGVSVRRVQDITEALNGKCPMSLEFTEENSNYFPDCLSYPSLCSRRSS